MTKLFAVMLAIGLLMAGAPPAFAAPAATGPSFDCSHPSEIEAVICADPELSSDDRRLMSFYELAKPGALGAGSNQLSVQRKWLSHRDKECGKGAWKKVYGSKSLRDCISRAYDYRLGDLAVATLLASPRLSLAELRRVSPKAAPIYEALLTYVSDDDAARRTKTTEALLTPLYAAMDSDQKNGLTYADGKAASPHEAATSDSAFARFFDISSMMGDAHLTWPCAALIKRPGLVEGLGSFWGGSIDGAVPNSDCEAALPPMLEVTALSREALDAQPACDGTIRFSTGREYSKLTDAVLLHRTDVWKPDPKATAGDGPSTEEKAYRRKHAAQIAAAGAALAAYYVKYYQSPGPAAERDARAAVEALVGGAFGLCD